MIGKIRNLYKKIYIKKLLKKGLCLGENVTFEKGVNIDANFPWLIEIKDNVILSPWVYILSHDSGGVRHTGYTRIGKVTIEKNVYIGARTIVLPGVIIGENSIIGANSVVTRDIPPNSVAVGIPAKVISSTEEYYKKCKNELENVPLYSRKDTIWGGVSVERKNQMIDEMVDRIAYIDTNK